MNRAYVLSLTVISYVHSLTVVISVALLFLMSSLQSAATTFSGRVVDEMGKPVSGLQLAVPGFAVPIPQYRDEPVFLPSQQTETDEVGEFQMNDITSPAVKLTLLPVHAADYEIRSVKIEGISFCLDRHLDYFGGFAFAIEPGADVEGIEIVVRPRMRIRGRVLLADGTPLRNERVSIRVEHRNIGGGGGGSGGGTRDLDAEGYFVEYVEEPAYYTVSVGYQTQSAESEDLLLKDGERHDKLVLTLDDKPPPKPDPAVAGVPDRKRFEAAWKRDREGVWAINPENRHAYKRIYCESREEAYTQAVDQGVHLVAINDAAEQAWLLEVFGRENFWIGLTDASKEENPHWDNGESLTYTNWNLSKKTVGGEGTGQDGEAHQNYTVLIGLTGKWQETHQGSPLARLTERAILEKARFTVGASELDSDIEKR
ncbi:MAG: lectin-like protein [Candidatus Poribacteria bacterium]|nr:lectin-like protein [Candidatus Poribacteria bacterium]